MTDMTLSLEQILEKAFNSKYGIEIVLDNPHAAKNTRRKLYAARENLRAQGVFQYDSLSIIIKGQDIWIVKKDTLKKKDQINVLDYRALDKNELPNKILSRGKSH